MHEASAVAHQTKRLLGGPLYFMAASSIYAVILAMWLPEGVWAACAGALRACAPLPDVIPFPLLLHVFMLQCHSCRTMPVKLSWVLTGCFCLHAGGSCSWDVRNSRGHRPCMAAFALLGSPSSKVGSLQAWFNYGLYLMSLMTLLACLQGGVARWAGKWRWNSALHCALLHGGSGWDFEPPHDQRAHQGSQSKVEEGAIHMCCHRKWHHRPQCSI